ncbi:1-acyl-sn-glycerol-3-phosphate acyltransferase beta isoform X2 [Syngnathus scovelli]|uniref:1-acyl-sn-glycerol-3-phosphate acyltransferase beta isoform X2 n=1 Tax=Syngnathus scovelli TaxID=161590 RepID=UPI002110B420|nr:1-acyl-sn-glycerol-3-phosphate acyltransferase beta isoform X1 [Syngnathus scovelli]
MTTTVCWLDSTSQQMNSDTWSGVPTTVLCLTGSRRLSFAEQRERSPRQPAEQPASASRIVRGLVRHVKYFLGLRFEVSGWEHLQTPGPYVIISNHQSSLDVLGLMEILPDRCTMIAKKELIYAGSVGIVCWLGGIIFINRKKTSDAKSVLGDAAKTMLDEQIRLWVFPEGTRNQRGDLLPFKKGAFHLAVQAQVPIIPVVFSSYGNFYLRKEKQFKSGTIRLKILPKIETKGMTLEDVASLADKSFDAMRSAFLDISGLAYSNGPVRH